MHCGVVATAEGRMKQEQKEHLLNINKWHEKYWQQNGKTMANRNIHNYRHLFSTIYSTEWKRIEYRL